MEWIELKEAARLTGRSWSTLKRFLVKHGIEQGQPMDQPQGTYLLYQKKDAPRGFYWHISKDSLFEYFDMVEQVEPEVEQDDRGLLSDRSMVDHLDDRVQSLETEIDRLHKIIDSKDHQIEQLHALMQQMQPPPKQLPHEPDKPTGVFSRVLVKFGL